MSKRPSHQREQPGFKRARIFLPPFILFVTLVAISYRVARLQYQADAEDQRSDVRAELEPIRGELARELFGALRLTEGLAVIVSTDGSISSERFRSLASELFHRSNLIRNIALAPDNTIEAVFPHVGNEKAIGFHYRQSPEQWKSIARMMAEKRPVVAGPTQLVQGGVGVIGRSPIYVRDTPSARSSGRYWGLISTVIDFNALMVRTRIASTNQHLSVALRGVDGLGVQGAPFWGDVTVFNASPVVMDVSLPSGSWQLAGLPKGGWSPFHAFHSSYFTIGNLIALTLALLHFRLLQLGYARGLEVIERRAAEGALRRANRALHLFSLVKSAIVRAKTQEELLTEVCRISVESAGYKLAWIGKAESDPRKTIRPVTFAGAGEFLSQIFVSWSDNEYGQGVAGTAIRTRAPAIARDLKKHAEFRPWRTVVTALGFETAIAVPIIVEDTVYGVISVCATEADAFDSTEVELLEEFGQAVSHGMAALLAHKSRDEAMVALEQSRVVLEERVEERTRELSLAKEKAESADRIKSAFLATMSHELRTPLNSIIGFTSILRQGLAGEVNPEQNKQLTMVHSSAQHLLALINDVLDISKIEAGQLKLNDEPFEFGPVVQLALETVTPIAARKGLRISANVPTTIRRVQGDRRRVEQVLLNLLSNAIKFTEQGAVSVDVSEREEHLSVAVRDTGIGIAQDDIPDLFSPFHQVDTGLSRRHEGTGLGLSICKRLVELMHGSIAVESTPGVGSVFIVRLPLWSTR
jgi:signal transduction histidine kinase/sensor domain CHASE-containing protein